MGISVDFSSSTISSFMLNDISPTCSYHHVDIEQEHTDIAIPASSNRVRLQRILMRRIGSTKLDMNVACSIMHLCHCDTINEGGGNAGLGLEGWGKKQLNLLLWALGHKNEHVLRYTAWTMCVVLYFLSLVFRSASPQYSPIRAATRPVSPFVCFTQYGFNRVFLHNGKNT